MRCHRGYSSSTGISWIASLNEILEAPATAMMKERAADVKANPNANKTKPGGGAVPYSPHRRVNRSSPCAWGDECV